MTTDAVVAAEQIRGIVARLANTIDTRRWTALRELFADTVTTDYTSLFGGSVRRSGGDALIDAWRTTLSPLDATQHLVGAIEVQLEGGRARAECHVRGYHLAAHAPGGPEWTVAGQWLIDLAQEGAWRITGMTLRTLYQTGNRALLSEAAAAGPARTG